MAIVLSLQGCMASGKTTAIKYIQKKVPYVNVSFESNEDVIQQIKMKNLNKDKFADYIEIQKLWITKEIHRYDRAKQFDCTIMEFGADEIEFYTLNYPKSIGADWDVEKNLQQELQQLRSCMPDRILFFEASGQVLKARSENDVTRTRTFFNHHLEYLLPLKNEWFRGASNVDVLNVNTISQEQVGEKVKLWIDDCIAEYK